MVANPNLANPTIAQWYNVAAFTAPSSGAFGTSAQGVIIGPPLNSLSSTMKKNFNLGERSRLRLEFVAIDTLNHPPYGHPDLTISNAATAGHITHLGPGGDSPNTRTMPV